MCNKYLNVYLYMLYKIHHIYLTRNNDITWFRKIHEKGDLEEEENDKR